MFINIILALKTHKNEGVGLQSIHTHRSQDQPVYPSSLALAKAASASIF